VATDAAHIGPMVSMPEASVLSEVMKSLMRWSSRRELTAAERMWLAQLSA
jgi:RNA polymerase-interacting CarD/CdnL/TRCF family regulator